ncbi:glycosyl-transferase for dystroglycan-domain-containing protein [Cunninghamella echinulata]|nr:glycosyl-transferase for dystroglycan-domain-containing protein [Cunninghamella echinulata]
MREIKQSATKFIQLLIIAYAFVSVIYTAKYFYGSYQQHPTAKSIRSEDGVNHAQQHYIQLENKGNNEIITQAYATDEEEEEEQQQQQQQEEEEKRSSVVRWHGESVPIMTESFVMSKLFSDAMQPSDLKAYYYKASEVIHDQDITMATLVTKDRFPVLSRLASNYQGPISVAIHVNDDEEKDQTLQELKHVYESNPDMQRYVDIHLVIDKFDRQFNLWRNVAKFFARTDYIMMLDVDFHICTNLKSLRHHPQQLKEWIGDGKRALVVPAFEYVVQADGIDYKTFPTTKDDLLDQVKEGKIDMFHKSWLKGHGATDYQHWYETNSSYSVTEYDYSYEPYIIYKKEGTPWCDERFIGYGANKAACLFEIYLSGIEYMVVPNDFLIHQTHKYPENTRRKERQYNRKLYGNFREELCLRYARMFMANGEWDTSRADNLKTECAKNRGYRIAMKSIL